MPVLPRALARAAVLVTVVLAVPFLLPAAPAAAAPAAPAAPDCGRTIYKADGTPWTCTFADDFDGSTLDRSRWYPQVTQTSGFGQNGTCFLDSTQNVAQSGGYLSLITRKANTPFWCSSGAGGFATQVSSGMVSTYDRFAQAYGRFEFRASFPNTSVPGLQSSLWMWPDDYSTYGALSGEIDVAEWYSQYSDRVIPYLHYVNLDPTAQVTNNYCLLQRGAMHTYRLDWTPTSITISYDDKVCLQNTSWLPYGMLTPAPFDQPFIVAMTQLLGSGGNAPSARTPFPATTKIDYVRVWS